MFQLLQALGRADAIDLDVLPRFLGEFPGVAVLGQRFQLAAAITACRQHRVDHHMNGEPGLGQHHAQRVDQEWHVFGGHFHDGVRGAPAIACFVGIEDTHQRTIRLAHHATAQMRERERGQRVTAIFGQVFFAHAAVVLADELLNIQRIATRSLRAGGKRDALDQLLTGSGNGRCHDANVVGLKGAE